ncbi:hypothetical protein CEXT_484211 [Caerostris extrusa]|uniref:Uncharacterized protein n=1 Tax=Caerostris extrusa TaxID=172846 RepID=A0AAV4RZD4_CAEEX|nr:hypothetical protein CEXT_484211 [Caerostris extrusa]
MKLSRSSFESSEHSITNHGTVRLFSKPCQRKPDLEIHMNREKSGDEKTNRRRKAAVLVILLPASHVEILIKSRESIMALSLVFNYVRNLLCN